MKAVIEENEVCIVPENPNEEYALREWVLRRSRPEDDGFVLEVQAGPAMTHAHRYRFKKDPE